MLACRHCFHGNESTNENISYVQQLVYGWKGTTGTTIDDLLTWVENKAAGITDKKKNVSPVPMPGVVVWQVLLFLFPFHWICAFCTGIFS
jgi:hypothetical protein